jgi:catechol 2,3-dioxygenase-like lactoylglutathione lyase family enzyme
MTQDTAPPVIPVMLIVPDADAVLAWYTTTLGAT